MKKTVRVIVEKEFEIEIPDHQLTPEHLAMFESGIFELNGNTLEEKIKYYFEYAGSCAARDVDCEWEGLGHIGSEYMQRYAKDKNYFVIADCTYDEIETEII